jgi:cysteine desulfurase/selenocysteine lyase
MNYPIAKVREDFPILTRLVHGRPLVYLDSAATAHKPRSVVERMSRFYLEEYGTVRRGVYLLSQEATALFEGVREQVRTFLNAARKEEIVFVRGVTEAINLVATSFSRGPLKAGDEVVISEMEHHANIVPWQLACAQVGATLRVVPIDDNGDLRLDALQDLLNPRTKIVSLTHVSNALGTVNPIAQIAPMVHAVGALLMVDGAQSAAHMPVDVQALGCDFYTCSGHKMLGPSGVGVLYGRYACLAEMPPYQGGGDMIQTVTFEGTTYEDPPHRFEAGTPPIAEVIGLGEALRYIEALGRPAIHAWEEGLLAEVCERLPREVPGLRLIGAPRERSGLVTFVVDGVHPFDLGTLVDHEGVAIRVGHHCAQPVMRRFGVPATARVSFAPYNTREEIDVLVRALRSALSLLR